jgi:VIT1/CCC1 family predicted Fe2+/Mn2+ transporter
VPFLIAGGDNALTASIAASAVALFLVGATLSLFTGRHAWRGGLRMLAIGAAAGALTYAIGSLVGVGLA